MRSKSRGRLGLAALLAVLAAAAWRETSTAPFQVEVQPRVQSWAQQGRFINHRGNPIFVTQSEGCRDASAPRVLTLHGFPTSSYDFRDVWPTAGRTLCLIAPDFLGFGLSGKPFHHSYSLMEQADIAERVLAELNVTQAHVFAHDYGDTVTLELIARQLDSLRHPEMPHPTWRLQTVTLLNGGVLPDKHRPLFMQKLLAHRTVGAAARLFITRRLFARSFAKVFGARTQPSERELDEHWTLVVRNNGNHVVDKLLGYMEERKRHERRCAHALRAHAPWRAGGAGRLAHRLAAGGQTRCDSASLPFSLCAARRTR